MEIDEKIKANMLACNAGGNQVPIKDEPPDPEDSEISFG